MVRLAEWLQTPGLRSCAHRYVCAPGVQCPRRPVSLQAGLSPGKGRQRVDEAAAWSYAFKAYKEVPDGHPAVTTNNRLAVRLSAEEKATIARAAAIKHVDLTAFVVRHALDAAREIIEQEERVALSRRNSQRVLDLLEHPPAPNARLLRAAHALPPEE